MFGLYKDRTVKMLERMQELQTQQINAIKDSMNASLALLSESVAANAKKPDETSLVRLGDAQRPVSLDWSGYGAAHKAALVNLEEYRADQVKKEEARLEEERKNKQKRVVYALNLCMVSLSQIVDYRDVNVLQQEYDAVLNNLNMEKIEKDEPLLDALKKILDVCHFYLLHSKDKEMLKKKQAARMKGALGRALGSGNVMAIFGTPNPWAIGAGILAMVGTAAVRYKSERDKARLENEVEEWELEKSALEQLHNLRRTLFETAWRLADKYGFPERYRLTEKQIKIYDEILTDPDPMNRYERLNLIKENFEAYPLFWYYLGRAALETAKLYEPVDEETRKLTPGAERVGAGEAKVYETYMGYAREAFDKFRNAHEGNEILREDLLAASAYLDYASFFNDPDPIMKYVDSAHALAGMDYEINQMCAFRYLQVHEWFGRKGDAENAKRAFDKAEYCLRFLLNENFNPELNGRALSELYKRHADDEKCRAAYDLLKIRVARKSPYVYNWILPWDDSTLQSDIDAYLVGDGLRRTIFNYHFGRLMMIYGDFFASVARARQDNDLQPVRDLKEHPALSGAKEDNPWDEDFDMTLSKFQSWSNADDPIYGCHQQFWCAERLSQPLCTATDVKERILDGTDRLLCDARVTCADKEYDFIIRMKKFIHATSERKWFTLGLYRHDADYCASIMDGAVKGIDAAAVEFLKDVAEQAAVKFKREYAKAIKSDLEFPSDAVYETPLGIQIVQRMESEAERMRATIAGSIVGHPYAYPAVEFKKEDQEQVQEHPVQKVVFSSK